MQAELIRVTELARGLFKVWDCSGHRAEDEMERSLKWKGH